MSEHEGTELAERLNHLFATIRPHGGHEYSNEHVASAITQTGVTISQSYIWQLRKAKKNNPTLKHLQALAGFFGVPTSYFVDDQVASRVKGELEALQREQARLASAVGGGEVRLMAMRAGELSAERRKQVMDLLDVVYRLERAEQQGTTED
ncbi:XRE family transcriptional regulator [Streptomyces sp. PU_AKi4]|jgi:transcriptional regulator with XRE-family HTH domain|uniref:XRE family transcriptional regulator n=1 Tax=Streptomyces sp. PU_AKi4 TaxID=2800809 RepID=UPI0035241BED